MKHGTHTLLLQMAAVLSLFLLNCCYFNSAGHILDNASYKAAVDMADAKPGKSVYTDGTHYYIELPRYKAGKPVKTQYSILDQEQEKPRTDQLRRTSEHTLVRIPEDYALYLTGQSQTPAKPSSVTPVNKDEDEIKQRCRKLAVTRQPEADLTLFPYKSAWPGGWQMLAALDWLCVDLPITCVENSLMICGITLYAICEGAQENAYSAPANTGTSTASTASTNTAKASATAATAASTATASTSTTSTSRYNPFAIASLPHEYPEVKSGYWQYDGPIVNMGALYSTKVMPSSLSGYEYRKCRVCDGFGYNKVSVSSDDSHDPYYGGNYSIDPYLGDSYRRCATCGGNGWGDSVKKPQPPPGIMLLKAFFEED